LKKLVAKEKRFQRALAVLETEPDNAEAHLAVGRWYCCFKGDWEKGLPHLAKGSDAALTAVARRELNAPPTGPKDQEALADAWWDLAERREGAEKEALLLRAGTWYQQAAKEVGGGLARVKLDKRLAEIAKIERPTPTSRTAINPADWRVWCYVGGRWVAFPLEKMTARSHGKALYVRNTTGFFEHASFFFWPTLFDGDFRLAAEVSGSSMAIGLHGVKHGKDRSAYFNPPPDGSWHTFAMQRKNGRLTMSWDGSPITPKYFEANNELGGHFAIWLRSGKEGAIRKFVYEKK